MGAHGIIGEIVIRIGKKVRPIFIRRYWIFVIFGQVMNKGLRKQINMIKTNKAQNIKWEIDLTDIGIQIKWNGHVFLLFYNLVRTM